jgi:hypothetical protein
MCSLFNCRSHNCTVALLLEVSSPFVRHEYNMLPVVLPLSFTNIFIVRAIHDYTSAVKIQSRDAVTTRHYKEYDEKKHIYCKITSTKLREYSHILNLNN